ncbi:GNAT family N-acetyltransferase [Marinimicrococcus flavescens]|uniref:GNAT family N-acetyltransferase n=1 Tax=Marinimicrococcus flavescens TaxID=3031815 RepID=A0AAP3UY59_9PROT|nr:GNAT family N-acetyltransferase [Marinimicrococcus flavescens]
MFIRRYRPVDRDRVIGIWLAASRVGHPFVGEAVLREQQEKVRDVYLPMAENWVAEVEGRIEGFIGLLDDFVGGLFVDPRRHGQGIGRSLLQHAATRHGRLTVSVYEANTEALAFYRRCGFLETSRKPRDAEGRPFAIITMRQA